MAEYIEREALPKRKERGFFHDDDFNAGWNACLNNIISIPAADVRPVVLCKDCTHSVQGKKSLECEKHRYVWNNMNRWVDEDDFCCWGVKREES